MSTLQQLTERAIRNRYRSLLKQHAIKTKDYIRINKLFYGAYKAQQDNLQDLQEFYISALQSIEHDTHPLYISVVAQLNKGRARKAKNIQSKITSMLFNGDAFFITLTFTDKVLQTTNQLTRRRYVARTLKAHANNYLANIDFGKTTGREHYHAVSNAQIEQSDWPYGFIKTIKIGHTESEPAKISKYITKLSNHALKPSTQGNVRFNAIIYSRNIRKEL